MSEAKRKGLEFAANQIGNAKKAYKDLIGNTSTIRTARLHFENNLIKFRGSSIFHDYDLSKKSAFGNTSSDFTTFDTSDIADFVIQGGSISVAKANKDFPNQGNWNPLSYSPPSLEGWNIFDYNAWSSYIPEYNASGLANTNYIIYNTLSEPIPGSGRTSYSYPIRYNGTGYERVPLFNFGRWISVLNNSGSLKTECEIIIPKSYFQGAININPLTNTPKDLAIYSHKLLVSYGYDSSLSLYGGSMGVLGVSDKLTKLAYNIIECNSLGNTFGRNRDYYKINIKLESGTSWLNNLWFHFVIYWSTHDTYFLNSYPTYFSGTALTFNNNNINTNWLVHGKKSFFNRAVTSGIGFSKTGVNDTNIYLYNTNNTNHTYRENIYTSVKNPFRYKISENVINSAIGITNELLGYKNLNSNEILPIIIAAKNSGLYYDEPEINLEVFAGEPISLFDFDLDYSEIDYYPSIPFDYNAIAKIILQYPSSSQSDVAVFSTTTDFEKNDVSIVYIEMLADNSLIGIQSDVDLATYFTNSFYNLSTKIRKDDFEKYFFNLASKIVSRFSRYDISKIRSAYHFENDASQENLALHNLLKNPKDNLLLNTQEPYQIDLNVNAGDVVKDYSKLQPTINIAGFSSTSLYINNKILSSDTNFEVYLEKYDDNSFDAMNDSGNSLEKDYSFRIQFSNTKSEMTIKDLYVNASKYYLTDNDYQYRVDNNLSVVGYYKSNTLNTINDFRLYSYAGVIPDLKMQNYRAIDTKQNAPYDTERITESDYELSLLSQNPSLNKNDLIVAKTGFGITDSFYVVDTQQPSAQFNTIRNLGITISDYVLNSDSHWFNNTNQLYGLENEPAIENAKHIKDLRSDSFVISGLGYTTSDGTSRLLENIKDQSILASIGSSINQLDINSFRNIEYNKIAIRINCLEDQEIKSFRVKLNKTSDYINTHSTIKSYLYSNSGNAPDEILSIGSSIFLKNIDNSQKFYDFELHYKLFKNKTYWVVLYTDTLPPVYDPYVTGLVNINDSSIIGLYNTNNNSFTNFSRYLPGAEIGIGSTLGSEINNWYPIVSIGSSTSMSTVGTGITLTKQTYSVRYKYQVGIKEVSSIGASTNMAYFASTGWTGLEGTSYIQFHTIDEEIYGSMNRDFTNSNLVLPPPNRYREQATYKLNGYWSFNCQKFENEKQLFIYPRSVYLQKSDYIASGIAGSNIVSIGSSNFSNKIMVGLGISQDSNISAGTSITNIIYSSSDSKYNLHLSSNIIGSLSDQKIGIGNSQNIYIRRANDIYINLNYFVNGSIASTTIVLDKSPTWITKWYSRTKYNYNILDKNISADTITNSYNLNFENYNVNNQQSYINGYSIGDFVPLSGIGTSFEFLFTSSYGVRVYINDETDPRLDNWKNSSGTANTFAHTLDYTSQPLKFEVQFNNRNSTGIGQSIVAYWRVRGTSTWNHIDDSFYIDSVPAPVLIDTNNIQKLSLMYVGKTLSEINTATFGSPPGDRIVLRSQ